MDRIKTLLRDLPVEDKLTVLVGSIIESCPQPNNALAVSLRMARVTAMLSKDLSTERRYRVAEALRTFADQLERRQVEHAGIEY
jgi:hypothetical protein